MLADQDEEIRLQAVRNLARLDPEERMKFIREALGDSSWRVRKETTDLFLSLPAAACLPGEIVELLHSEENAGLRNAAVDILIRLGRVSIPYLLEEITCTNPDVRKFVLDILGEIGDATGISALIDRLGDEDQNVRTAAAENLGKLGAPEAVPALLAAMEESDLWLRFAILEAISQIGSAEAPAAKLLPYRHDPMLRKALFDCLGRLGDLEAGPALVEGLNDPMRNVREAAAVALYHLGEKDAGGVERLLGHLRGTEEAKAIPQLLESGEARTRVAALHLLGLLGDERFAGSLLDLMSEEEMRGKAARILVLLGQDAVCSLLGRWEEGDWQVRTFLAYLCGEVGCAEGLPLLAAGLASDSPDLVNACAAAVGRIGDLTVLPALVEALEGDDLEIRQAAVGALQAFSGRHPEAVLQKVSSLQESEDPGLRMAAVEILGSIFDPAVEAKLTFALKDESPLVRRTALGALEKRDPAAHIDLFMLAMTDEDDEVRRLAVETLGRCGAESAQNPLTLALGDENFWVRAAAVRAIGRLNAPGAVETLLQALDDPVGMVVIAVLETLAEMDPDRSYQVLIGALKHPDEEVVHAALELLRQAGRREWPPRLIDRLLNHPHWEVRAAFARLFAETAGAASRPHLENRLLIEGEDLVRRQIQDLLAGLDSGGE